MRKLLFFLLLGLQALAQGRVPIELCGQWSYFSGGGTYTGGSYSVQRWVVLNQDGTYIYHGENANGGGNGQAYGDSEDRGRWWIEGETLCTQSVSGQSYQFPIELRNNKNGDPMIVIDGDPYVTATQRAPWPW
ncbi:hypothetical protein JST97_37525 [bacterium]|nr:hypothetical protein [bacterium]